MCEGSFLPSSFGPHQKHTEFESRLRSYPISSNVLCKLSKLHGTAEAMCNENRGFLTASLEMDKRRRPARSGLLQNGSQGRAVRSRNIADPPTHPCPRYQRSYPPG